MLFRSHPPTHTHTQTHTHTHTHKHKHTHTHTHTHQVFLISLLKIGVYVLIVVLMLMIWSICVVKQVFLMQLLDMGFFHSDPHPGNLLVDQDGRLTLIDFGTEL